MMKKNSLIWVLVAVLLCVTLVSCKKYNGFKRNSGVYYQFHELNEGNEQPKTGDFVVVNMALRVEDSVLSPMTQNNMLMDDLYKGDIYTALRMMHLGDSATFIFDGRKFYEEFLGMGEYPYGKKPIYADIKLLRIMSKQNLERAEELYEERKELMRHLEDSLINNYVDKNHITNKIAGIYCEYVEVGNGEKAEQGCVVDILFRAFRLDGSEFDRSLDPENPFTFELGMGQVARGLDILVMEMREGDKITMVFPSSLAFGEQGFVNLNIAPYTPVVYEVELLHVHPPKNE
ncbi:MAG: FKBP-type peptidyl-prolyl cis-trans isomerase [Bacteroidales bacterium]|jgi:FKBP-type peptidyl-prolyl cis-trans isomerase|nr:FKBP-type peptidyl-prolyl cis-trans isomerase [Bacteroidales bacterium]